MTRFGFPVVLVSIHIVLFGAGVTRAANHPWLPPFGLEKIGMQADGQPPSLELTGARLAFPAYSAERRAVRLVAESPNVEIHLRPAVHTMDPVFEIEDAAQQLTGVSLGNQALPPDAYAWDGTTLWVRASIDSNGAKLTLHFRQQ